MESAVSIDPSSDRKKLFRHEWLVANGRGDYAMGTVAGPPNRSYHGMLVSAANPPVQRRLLVARLDDWIRLDGVRYPLFFRSEDPSGREGVYPFAGFHLDGTTPVWRFQIGETLLEKRVTMAHGEPITYVNYRLIEGGPASVESDIYVDYRDHHTVTSKNAWSPSFEQVAHGLAITPPPAPRPVFVLAYPGEVQEASAWVDGDRLTNETDRGLADRSAVFHAASIKATLVSGASVAVVCSEIEDPPMAGFETEATARHFTLLDSALLPARTPGWVKQLVLAADQFLVDRTVPETDHGKTIIAGYPWFTDWGRDTMIALPGLTLVTGRPEIAGTILRTYAGLVDEGMLPNHFPDGGEDPIYNTADATLWFIEAVRQTWAATADQSLIEELAPVLEDVIRWHRQGTRFGIGVDPRDGLLTTGEPEVQLTWMDAVVDGWVVTPRIGKPVEVNALWYQALSTMGRMMTAIGRDATTYTEAAGQVRTSFSRFWNPDTACLFDVIDGPDGNDPSVRPNQIFAVSLPDSPLTEGQQQAVVNVCRRDLLTSFGLRSLAPSDPDYRGRYGGDRRSRDGAYHQGTVWGWLLGPFALAVHRTTGDADLARSFLLPMEAHLNDLGLGGIAEIFEGDPPHAPRGCPWQAWSVGEVLRAWRALEEQEDRFGVPKGHI
jgi:predicted glycogen debranching enzyme